MVARADWSLEGNEPKGLTASPIPAERVAITSAARYLILMAMISFIGPTNKPRALIKGSRVVLPRSLFRRADDE